MSTIPSTRGNPHASDIAVQTATPMLGGASREDLQTVVSNTDTEIAKLFEDRNMTLTGGGLITYNAAGTSVSFSQALNLEINSQVAGGAPTVVQLVAAAGSKTVSADGRMIYAVVNRLAGTATVTDDSATLAAVTSANQEVFLIAKRRDASGPIPKLYFRNGFVLAANQASELGQAESFIDSEFFVSDATDNTIKFKVDAAGTTGTSTTLQTSQTTNKTITLPDVTDTLVAKTTTDILSNKTLQTLKGTVTTDSTTTGADATLQAADITTVVTRLTNGSLTSVGGIPAGTSGQIVIVENQTTVLVSIKDEDTVATAANRIRTGTGSTVQMPANSTFMFTYDSTAARWMLSGGSGSGSGSGEINVITNPNDATNWVASGAGVTVASTTTASDLPLGSVISTAIKITPVSGTDYVRYRWTMPTALKNKKLKAEWFQHFLAGYASGDLKLEIYKNSASDYSGSYTKFALSTDVSTTSSIPATDGKYTSSFDADSADYYELRIVRTAGTTALAITNVIVGPGIQPQGAIAQDPQTLSTTYDNLGTVANNEVTYTRYGARMRVQGRVTTGTTAAGIAAIVLPSGFTLATGTGGLSNQASGIMVGSGRFITSGGTAVDQVPATFAIYYDGSTTTKLFISDRTTSSSFTKRNGNDMFATSDVFVYEFDVPVAEWIGNGVVSLAQNDVEYLINTNTSTSASDTTSFGYGSAGTAIVAIVSAGATVKKRIRALRPMGSNKGRPKLQVSPDGTLWMAAESQFLYTEAGAQRYGVRLTAGGTAATDIDVEFGGDGANGTEAWSTYTSWFWRVVMEQPGVAIGFGLADASSSGLLSAASQTVGGAKTFNDIITFKSSSGATTVGNYTTAGAWNLGFNGAVGATLLTLGGDSSTTGGQEAFVIRVGTTGTNRAALRGLQNNVSKWLMGSSTAAGDLISGDAAGDLAIIASTASINISADGGTTKHASSTSAGVWTFGPSASTATNLNVNGSVKTTTGTANGGFLAAKTADQFIALRTDNTVGACIAGSTNLDDTAASTDNGGRIILQGGGQSVFGFATSNTASGTRTWTTIGTASLAGIWLLGPAAGGVTHQLLGRVAHVNNTASAQRQGYFVAGSTAAQASNTNFTFTISPNTSFGYAGILTVDVISSVSGDTQTVSTYFVAQTAGGTPVLTQTSLGTHSAATARNITLSAGGARNTIQIKSTAAGNSDFIYSFYGNTTEAST